MSRFSRLVGGFAALFRKNRIEQDLDEELRAYLEASIDEKVRAGLSREDAVRAARVEFGSVDAVKDHTRDVGWETHLESLWRDLRYALRMLRRTPAFSLVAVLTLTLGIGANTAIFTLIDAVMLRSLPVRSAGELVSVGDPSRPTALWEGAPMLDVLSYPLYERLRDRNGSFTGLLASGRSGRIEMDAGDGGFEEVRARLVSANYFDVLGASPAFGRTFSPNQDRVPGASPMIVISDDFWTTRFGREQGILGRAVRLNGSPFTVIGVGPRHFTGEVVGSPTDIWIPLSMQPQVNPGRARLDRIDSNWLLAMGRLKPGVSLEAARADLTRLAHEALAEFAGGALSSETLQGIRRRRVSVQAGAEGFSWIRKHDSSLLFTLMLVVVVVLVIACANLANLLLARATNRRKEMAVRLALGASRQRLIRQLLTEAAVLATIGGSAGLLLAGWGSRLFARLAAGAVPFDVDVHPNITVLAFTATIATLAVMLFGLVPALRSTRALSPTLKAHGRPLDHAGFPIGKLLVIGQLALSVPLLVLAGLFVRSLANLEALDVGYSRENLLALKVDVAGSGFGPAAVQQSPRIRSLTERLQATPGVVGVTVSENGLFSGTDSRTEGLQAEGFRPVTASDGSSSFDHVGPHYFEVIGIPLLAGRDLDDRDAGRTAKVVVINETLARFYFKKRNPIGKSLRNGSDYYTVVGVVKDSKQRDLSGKPERRFYVSMFQNEDPLTEVSFVIRTRDDATLVMPTIRRELRLFDPSLKVTSLESVRALMRQSVSGDRSRAQVSGLFGVVALLLAAAGLYGTMSYGMSRRTNEIGLRLALGADRRLVIGMVLRESVTLMAAGLAIGIPAALGISRLTAASLVGVTPTDPGIIAATTVVTLLPGIVAGLVPAVRASRIDPVVALRHE
jgi:putative ABC transport system permease protein